MNARHLLHRLRSPALIAAIIASFTSLVRAQSRPPEKSDSEVITLSEFQVSTSKDSGYRASNSVTGSRFDTPIKDLPFALQAFTSEFINDIHPSTIYDIALFSPGVTYRSSDFTNGNAEVAIRGFQVAPAGYSAQTLRDGLKGPPIMDFANIERVEIVKGPASFLYGQVAPGGMVNMITKSPKEKFQGSVTANYGSYREHGASLDLTGPIGSGLYYRAILSYTEEMHYWKPYDAHQWDFAPQLLYKLNEKASLSVKFERFEKTETPQLFPKLDWGYTRSGLPEWANVQADPLVANAILPAGLPANLITSNDPNLSGVPIPLPRTWNQLANSDYRKSDDSSLSVVLDVKADEHWSVRGSYAYDKNTIDMNFSGRPPANPNVNAYTAAYNAAIAAGQTPAQAALAGFPNSGFAQARRWRWQTTDRLSNSIEGQALGSYVFSGVSLKMILGAQYNPYSFHQKNAQAPASTNPVYNPSDALPPWDLRDPSTWNRDVPSNFSRSITSLTNFGTPAANNDITRVVDQGFFLGTTWGFFNDSLIALAGIRKTYTSLQTEHDFNTAIVPGAISQTVDPEFKSSRNTPQVGLLYKARRDVSLFASYSESFVPAAGTLTVIDKSNPNNWLAVAGAPIQPTIGKGYDIGAKADLFDGRLSGTVTYYDLKNQNIVVQVPEFGPNGTFFPNFQSGEQESKGVEMDVTYSPMDNWQIYASASFMDAKTTVVVTRETDARMLAVNTYAGYLALNAADQASWRNVWRFYHKPLQMTAPRLYNVWTKYNFTGALKGFFVGGGANIVQDQTIGQEMEARFHQHYVLWNALAGYSTKITGYPTTFTLNGKNLSDELYQPSQTTTSRPREFVLSVSTQF